MKYASKLKIEQTNPRSATRSKATTLGNHRPEAIAQRKLANAVSNSPQLVMQCELSDAIDHSPQMTAQRAIQREVDPRAATNTTGLPSGLKAGIESMSGISMDNVKVHYNSDKPSQLQALAHTQGPDIHVGPGQEKHLPHEAWHVVQQAQGRVEATMQMKNGVAINDDAGLEHEADVMGAKAASYSAQSQTAPETREVAHDAAAPVQCMGLKEIKDKAKEMLHPNKKEPDGKTHSLDEMVLLNALMMMAPGDVEQFQRARTTFLTRIRKLEGDIPALEGQVALHVNLWNTFVKTVTGVEGMTRDGATVPVTTDVPTNGNLRNNAATNPQIYKPGSSTSYETKMSETFNILTGYLKSLSDSQFANAKGYAFWNGVYAKDVAKEATTSGLLALETSGIGGLFDDLGTLKGNPDGWDPELWAELSRAYASKVVEHIFLDPKKSIFVMCGLNFTDPQYNIWNSIENPTLEVRGAQFGLSQNDVASRIIYCAVASKVENGKRVLALERKLNVNGIDIAGIHTYAMDPKVIVEAQLRQQQQMQIAKVY
ncbi:MAG TPA: DUF4157 domain-containing protein [Polyangium sp.]|nr:DUF4157 domain-containing protein [Polyangium sp.]